MQTFSKVHTTHDMMKDGVRAEVKVQSGRANVVEIVPSSSGRAANIIVQVDGSQYKMNGWVPKGDPVYEKAVEAERRGEPLDFRIEHIRRDKYKGTKEVIDRSIPIEELTKDMMSAQKSINKAFAAAKLIDEEEWTFSPTMKTRMEEDPADGVDIQSMPLEKFTGGQVGGRADENKQSYDTDTPPYVDLDDDGNIRPGSYAAAVPINILSYVMDENRKNTLSLSDGEQSVIAKTIIRITNDLQNYMYDGELPKPDLGAYSHTRARAITFQVIENFFPMGKKIVEDKDTLIGWRDEVLQKAQNLWDWNLKELEKYL